MRCPRGWAGWQPSLPRCSSPTASRSTPKRAPRSCSSSSGSSWPRSCCSAARPWFRSTPPQRPGQSRSASVRRAGISAWAPETPAVDDQRACSPRARTPSARTLEAVVVCAKREPRLTLSDRSRALATGTPTGATSRATTRTEIRAPGLSAAGVSHGASAAPPVAAGKVPSTCPGLLLFAGRPFNAEAGRAPRPRRAINSSRRAPSKRGFVLLELPRRFVPLHSRPERAACQPSPKEHKRPRHRGRRPSSWRRSASRRTLLADELESPVRPMADGPRARSFEAMADHALPDLELRALVRRAAPPAAGVAVAAAGVLVARAPLQAFADALERALAADPRWVAGAAVLELLSFTGYIALLWLVGGRATPRLDLRASAQVTLGGAAATRLLPTAGVGGAALTLCALPAAGATSAIVGGLALAVRRPATAASGVNPVARAARARARVRSATPLVGDAVRDALALLRSGDPRLLGALAWWAFDAAVLWAMLQAFGASPALAVVVLAYFVGQAGNTIPVPGAVSGGIVGVLLAFGVQTDLALVSVLAYRAVAMWLPAPIGLAALGALRRTVARWSRENAPRPQPSAAATPRRHRDPLPVEALPGPEL